MRRRFVLAAAVLVAVLVAAACGKEDDSMTLTPYDEDQELMQAIDKSMDESVVLRYKVNDDVSTVKVGCESYDKDQLLKDEEEFSGGFDGSEGLITMFFKGNKGSVSVSADDELMSAELTAPWDADSEEINRGFAMPKSSIEIEQGKKVYFYARYEQKGNEMEFSGYEPDPDEMKKHDKSYFFYVIFHFCYAPCP